MDSNVYNHLIAGFQPKPAARYSAHKTSELRAVVRNITKITRSSPIYLVQISDEKQSYALGIKESAMSLYTACMELSDSSEDSVFSQLKAVSSDERQAGAEIKTKDYNRLPEPFSIKVNHLAGSQVNIGKELNETGRGPAEGLYKFRVMVDDAVYDFQYNVKKNATHRETMSGLSKFITKANIGIIAEPISREKGKIAMRLESVETGSPDGSPIFNIQDRDENGKKGLISYYSLDHVAVAPKSASFELNGVPKESLSNDLLIGKVLQVNLNNPSGEAAEISYRPDSEKILSGVQKVLDAYNQMVSDTLEYTDNGKRKPKLMLEMQMIMNPYLSSMESCGIVLDKDGFLKMDESLAVQAAEDGDMQKLFGDKSSFCMRMMKKSDSIKLNPMEYVDKIIVSYPDYDKPPVGYAYITSLYSGMLFNYYC